MKSSRNRMKPSRSVFSSKGYVTLGVCAMAKKVKSEPMQQILHRLSSSPEIQLMVFPEHVIFNEPIENWPVCDCLISFFSTGFPLSKAIEYAQLRQPFLINDLEFQLKLLDRRQMYDIMRKHGIPTPRFAVMSRDTELHPSMIIEEDSVQINGERFDRPFVEKPVSGEDHNIIIYFPRAAGGGSQHLFRKVGDRSSEFMPDHQIVRTEGSYIYEEFLPTQGTDVKVYTVGPSYFHAEARKAPAVDGKVNRNEEGKEIRYPITLTSEEKQIALKITLAFHQNVCGFDLLRANGKSYVCDVNGWSFVKNSQKYYDDCASILREIMIRTIAPRLLKNSIVFGPVAHDDDDIEDDNENDSVEQITQNNSSREDLRCVVAIIRHGDRTPKQKMKMVVTNEKILAFLNNYGGDPRKEVKLKSATQLQKLLDITRNLIKQSVNEDESSDIEEGIDKLKQMKAVLEKGGYFSGINRKVQIKPLSWRTLSVEGLPSSGSGSLTNLNISDNYSHDICTEALLVLKWGGELTDAGRVQAEQHGHAFRMSMYPGEDGLLRLHSTYRHDLKIYASDEGRVQVTAAAFAKGLLDLEGELTPILVSLVVKDREAYDLLDEATAADSERSKGRTKLHELMTDDRTITPDLVPLYVPTLAPALIRSTEKIQNPLHSMHKLNDLFTSFVDEIRQRLSSVRGQEEPQLYHGETLALMLRRYQKLEKDFFNRKKNRFDISKIPDLYDCVKYDIVHNQSVLQLANLRPLYDCAKMLADFVVPQEYGLTEIEKREVGVRICANLIRKILSDLLTASGQAHGDDFTQQLYRLDPRYTQSLKIKTPGRHVRTRLYFTSESHIHSLINILRYGTDRLPPVIDSKVFDEVEELDYLTTIVFRLYDKVDLPASHPDRFRVSMSFSPGAASDPSTSDQHIRPLQPIKEIASNIPFHVFEQYLRSVFDDGRSRSGSFHASDVASPTFTNFGKLSPSSSNVGLLNNVSLTGSVASKAAH